MKRDPGKALAVCAALALLTGGMQAPVCTPEPAALTAAAAEALSGTLIRDLTVFQTAYAESWAIDESLAVGDQVFADRTVEKAAFSDVPAQYLGAELLLTPCDAKVETSDLAAFTAGADMTVYIGFDSRVSPLPAWISGWTQQEAAISASNGVTFVLFAKDVEAGGTVTLGTNGQSSGCMNYIVLAAASRSAGTAGDLNADGTLDLLDLVLLQKWLLAVPDTKLSDWEAGDLNADRTLDVFDLALMKRALLTGNAPEQPSDPEEPTQATEETGTTEEPQPTDDTQETTEEPTEAPTVPYDQRSFAFSVKSGLFDQNNTDTLGLSEPAGLETVTVWRADDSSDHYCNGVCLAAYNGKLYCQWQSSAVDEDSDDTHVMYAVSSDGGRTWDAPQVLAQNIGDGYCTSGGWLATEDRLVAYINFWDNGLSVRGGFTYYMTSEDGTSWSTPQLVTMADGSPMNGVFEQDPHVLSTGRIVNAAHFQDGLFVCPIYTGDPSGITGWKKGAFTASGSGTSSTEMEPSLFVQSDGTFAMIFRDQNSSYKKLISYSLDDGAAWSKVQSTDMPDARTKQSAGNLSDGTAFMAGCPVNNSLRSPLAVTLSADGKSFDRAYLLRSNASDPALMYEGKAKRQGFHYCKSLVYDGKLYVGYATNKEAVEISIVPEESLTK